MVFNIASDVLILGAGGAGLRAAIEAEAHGVSVAVVSKSPAGMNNASVVSGGNFRAAVGGLTPEFHLADTISVGKGINDHRLVEVLAQESGKRVLELRRFDVDIHVRSGAVSVGSLQSLRGLGLTKPLVDYALSRGVRFFENVIVTKLLKNDADVIGAAGYDAHNDRPIIFSSKAVVIATGGAGALYRRTDCPQGAIGDGYALSYGVGARLRDMEFVQFYPLIIAEPGLPPYRVASPISEEGSIINNLGEDIPKKYNISERPLVSKSRDLLSRAIMIEVLEGRGVDGSVLVDATKVFNRRGDEALFSKGPYAYFKYKLKASERPLRVAPVSHFCMGGVIIDEHCNTGVPGLFAAGEVVGGVHGANRHGGNALTDAIVFGALAGAASAEYSKERNQLSIESAESELQRYKELRGKGEEEKADPRTIMLMLKELMWTKAGVVRDEKKLREAMMEIAELKELTFELSASSGRMMLEVLEVSMAIEVADMICMAALERKESRGAHYRMDYNKEDRRWIKSIVISKGPRGEMQISIENV